jgi:hypothetical protein
MVADSHTQQKIRRLEDARLTWGIVFFNALSEQRMAQAERMIATIDRRLAKLRGE